MQRTVTYTKDYNYFGGYSDWLCELINLNESLYSVLIEELYVIPFEWIDELDQNRNRDGILLREEFRLLYPEGLGTIGDRSSVLEVLIGLARRMDYLLDDDDRGDRTRIWFWEFIKNLNLKKFTNEYIDQYGYDTLNEIHDICEVWMNREFGYDGVGSPFPLKHPMEHQAHLDMIRQLNAYILENHMHEDELL